MSTLRNDLKVGFRQMGKDPGNMLLAVFAYAIGLGLVGLMLTLLFGVVRAHPDDLDFETVQTVTWDDTTRHLWRNGAQSVGIRFRDFRDVEESQEAFEYFAAARGANFNVVVDKYAERYTGEAVTADYFKALGTSPALGHFFTRGDDTPGSEPKAVISHKLWKNGFRAQESIIGRSILINGRPTTVIGVAREGFDFPAANDIWVNETIDHRELERAQGHVYAVYGSLKQGESVASALASLNAIAKRLEAAYPDTNTGYLAFELNPIASMYLDAEFRNTMYLMFACAALVLLIACTNVANLSLSRATTRMRELAIRASLGGKRLRLIVQMLVEGLTISTIGGIGGLIIAIWTSKVIWGWATTSDANNIPSWMNMDVDIEVIAALSIATFLASIIASIIPAIQASRADINAILKDSSRGSSGLRLGAFSKLLALLQLCISCGLLIATSTLVSAARDTAKFEPYYDPSDMMVARFDLPVEQYPDNTRAETLAHLQQKLEASEALSGVGFTSAYDMMFNWPSRWDIRGRESKTQEEFIPARHEIVSDNYFDLLGIPILYGRGFEAIDRGENAEQVCVINEVFAKRHFPDQSPIGQQIRDVWDETHPWLTIIGVVPDTRMAGPGPHDEAQRCGVYRPMSTAPQTSVTVFAKTSANPLSQARHVQSVLHEFDNSIALYRIKTVEQAIKDSNFGPLFYRNMFGMFGLAALALASIGVYGVMAFSVRQRFQEFGIRQALGAGKAMIITQVLKMGGLQIAAGILLGIALGWSILVAIAQSFNGLEASFLNYAIPITALVGIAALALYIPARYATRIDLATCLRDE